MPVNQLPDMDRFGGLRLEPPSLVAIQYSSASKPNQQPGPHEFLCSTEQAYQLYLHLAEMFHDLGPAWPPAQPGRGRAGGGGQSP
jgi:hypothetical protein